MEVIVKTGAHDGARMIWLGGDDVEGRRIQEKGKVTGYNGKGGHYLWRDGG
jgi:hypothetical protein